MLETLKTPSKGELKKFQDFSQKVMCNKKSDKFVDHFAHNFGQKPTPQQCHEIRTFVTLSMVNPISLINTLSKSSCMSCMK